MTDSHAAPDATPLADPGPPPPRPPGAPSSGDRFFAWLRGLDLRRTDGWVGGVCAGIAQRIGIDPIIVRGVFVVAALFSLPMFLVYAVGWALLPDSIGRIHLQDALRRTFDPAMVGIGLLLLVSLFPLVPWFFGAVLPFGFFVPGAPADWSPLGVLVTIVVATLVVGLLLLIARSSKRAPLPGDDPAHAARMASASVAVSPAVDESGVDVPADPAPDAFSPGAGSAPPPPPSPAATEDLAEWRRQHDAWKAQDDAWRRQQKDAESLAREQARAERAVANEAFASEAAERRRIRRLTRPRTSASYVVVALGIALIVGAATALAVGAAQDDTLVSVAVGFFAGALVIAVAMIVAGALRRRSGFLAFVAIALLVTGASTGAPAVTQGIAFGSTYVSAMSPQSFTQLWGHLSIDLSQPGSVEPMDIVKRDGTTSIYIAPDMRVRLEIRGLESVQWALFTWDDGEILDDGTWEASIGSSGEPVLFREIDTTDGTETDTEVQIVRIDQSSGDMYVEIRER